MAYRIIQPAGGYRLHQGQVALFGLAGADMNVTTDQAFTKIGNFTRYAFTQARIGGASVSLTTAVGGVYAGAGKTGYEIITSGASYAAVTGSSVQTTTSLNAVDGTDIRSDLTWYLSLTTPQGAAATLEMFELWGYVYE